MGEKDVFVHISAFNSSERPEVGQILSYEMEADMAGRPRAVRVLRPGERRSRDPQSRPLHLARNGGLRRGYLAFSLILLLATDAYAWQRMSSPRPIVIDNTHLPALGASNSANASKLTPALHTQPSPYQCDGRIHCSEMRSCAEAKYFLKNCPGTKMDGDNDGTPCESQWC